MNLSNKQIELLNHISEVGCDGVWCGGGKGYYKGTPCPFSWRGNQCIAYTNKDGDWEPVKRQARELLYQQGVRMTPEGVKNHEARAQAAWEAARAKAQAAWEASHESWEELESWESWESWAEAEVSWAEARVKARESWEAAWEAAQEAWDAARRSGGGEGGVYLGHDQGGVQ